MPANRSRTDRWRDCLWQIYERGGAIEVSVARPDNPEPSGHDLVWRVKIARVTDDEIVVDQPAAFGRTFRLDAGTTVVGAMSIGQNRWMFRTQALPSPADGRLRLAMPEHVERCQRRSYYRASTGAVALPPVECWNLLDPTTVVAAEVANEAYVRDMQRRRTDPGAPAPEIEPLLPDVGPRFTAELVNISGGGLGLLVPPGESAGLERARFLWMRLDLRPDVAAPIGMTGRLVHTHMDSAQNVHAGLAFEFGFHPAHRDFVIREVCALVARLQTAQACGQAA
jgi:c-di-GMP-binding flagellar brake protein YcgR